MACLIVATVAPTAAATTTYTYDALNRLTQVEYSSGARISYTYDAVGNRLTLTSTVPTFPLSVTRAGSGSGTVTSTPAGIDCGATCSAPFNYGISVTLTATPSVGSTFTGWGGDCTGTGTCTVSMTQARNVTATFTLQSYTLTVTKAGTGTVTSTPPGIDCGATCTASFAYGTSVTLTASPATGSTFSGWSGDCTGTGPCTVSMTQARSVTATFTLQSFALTVTKSGTGSGTVTSTPPGITCGTDCTESYAYGTSVTLTATPATGSTFAGWSGACTGTSPTCTVSMTQARSVTAVFTGPIPTLALSVNQPSFRRGETLTLGVTVTPGATSQVVDAYVAIALPGGPLLFLQGDGNFTTDVRPIVTNWTAVPFSGEIFRYTFSGGEPPGSYTWYAAFTVPGGNPLFGTIGPIVSAPFSFSP